MKTMQLTCFSRDSSRWGRYSAMHLWRRKKNYEHDDMLTHILLLRQNDMITYIPSNHGGSLKSSIEKIDFKSEVDSNFRRGAEEADTYFLPTG